MDDTSPRNKAMLVDSIQSEYSGFKELLSGLAPEDFLHPGVNGDWTVKDVLAHIQVHEERMIAWISKRIGGSLPSEFQPYDMPEDALAVVNERIYQENRARELDEVEAAFAQAHRAALALVDAAAEADLFDAARYHLNGGEALWAAVAANTYEHYEEHGRDIRAWLAVRAAKGGG
jgi:hypothetical protein